MPVGERGRAPLERMWARPTADINGIWGGYTGAGSKTVIAAQASAKVSFRLVPGQDPAAVYRGVQALRGGAAAGRCAGGVQLFGSRAGHRDRRRTAAGSPRRAAALAEEYGRPAVLMGSGGSIPVVESMRRILGVDSLLMGFGLADDQVHSPNEKFEWRCFHHGLRSHARLLAELASG